MRIADALLAAGATVGLALLAGCGDGSDAARAAPQVTDSAGVRIVVNHDVELPSWRVDPEPFVSIGAVEGGEGQDLSIPWSSLLMSDGRIAVADAGSNELRVYGPDGAFVRAIGGPGEGPGEFGLIAALRRLPGDTLVVADAITPRLTLIGPAGELVRTVPLEPIADRMPRLRGLVDDTTAAYRATFFEQRRGGSSAVRDTFLLALRPLTGGATTELGRFPATEKFNQVLPSGSVAGWNLPLGRDLYTAAGGGRLWVGVSDSYRIEAYDGAGQLRTVVRLDRPLTQVTGAEHERFFEYQLASAGDPQQRQMYADFQAIAEFPPTMPAFSSLHTDAHGQLWVRDYAPPWADEEPVWHVYDATGQAVARVRLPPGLDVHEIGEHYVIGRWRDDLDVEYIRMHRLVREG